MPIPVDDILRRTDALLLDDERVRWPAAERIDWINEAAGAILNRRPAARSRNVVVSLVAGTKQAVPAAGATFLDLVRNIKADGTTPGRAIRRTDRQLLDDTDPDWHTRRQKSEVRHYTFDDRAPKQFYVYPPAVAGTKAELVYAELPATVADGADSFDFDFEYLEAVVNYVCYRCKAKDSEYANAAEAAAYFSAFEEALGMKSQSQVNASPNQPETSV